MNTTRVLQKQKYNMVTTTRPRSTATLRYWQKSLLKSTILKVLKKSVTHFLRLSSGRDTTRLTKPRQRTIRKISLLIEYGRARFVTNIVTHHTWPSHKRSNPHPQPPHLSKHFSNIYLFPDLTIFVLTTLFRRRFHRTFREIVLTSRPEIRSDPGSDGPLTALMTPMI